MNDNLQELILKTAKETHNGIEVVASDESTYIIVTAVNKESSKNYIHRISCIKGSPIGGYCYDVQSDSYHIDCADYLHLGSIPVSYMASSKEFDSWKIRIPMPENVIKKYLTPLQKKELKIFKTAFKSPDFDIKFIQMIDPN